MCLLWMSYHISNLKNKPVIWGRPAAVSIEPTTSCNLRCPECPSGLRSFSRPTGMLQPELFQKIIDQSKKHLTYLTLYFQGEPYLNPNLFKLLGIASKARIYTTISTNAHYLSNENSDKTVKSGLDRLIISIDGTTQETYESYRIGGKLSTVLEGVENIIASKKKLKSATPYVVFQFLVVRPNEHQIEEAKTLAANMGVDSIQFKTAQIYDYESGSNLIPTIDYYSRYKLQENGSYSIKNKMDNKCWRMWHACVITWDGSVVPCCFDKDATHVLGELNEEDFRSLWNGQRYQSFREKLMIGRGEIDICKNCTEGTKVWG